MKFNRNKTAACFGVTIATVDQWRNQGCPCIKLDNGTLEFDSVEVFNWKLKRERIKKQGIKDSSEADERYRIAKAETAEFDLSVKQREFIATDEVETVLSKAVLNCKSVLTNIAPKLATTLTDRSDPKVIQGYIEAEVRRSLTELANIDLDESYEEVPEDV